MTIGAITIDFEEIGIPMRDGWRIGFLSGSAEVDDDEAVVSITVLARRGDEEKWITYPIPPQRALPGPPLTGDDRDLRMIADEIQERLADEITFKLLERDVALAEQGWEHPEAAE